MPLSDDQIREIISELATRPGHEKVRALLHRILVDDLGAASRDINFEKQLPEVSGRADALLGRTVFELKSNLQRETGDAEEELGRYLSDRERATGQHFLGIATDGLDWIPYELRGGKLAKLTAFRASVKPDPRALLAWLSPLVTLRPELRPEPDRVRKELGKESLVYEIAKSRLESLWDEVKAHPDVVVKRQLWADRLQMVYGSRVDSDDLFFQHTYLTIVAKTMATLVLGVELPEPANLLSGKPFQDAGINGVVESDFFDWVLEAAGSTALVHGITAQVSRFRLGDIRHDVLKGLYESLIDPEQRHDLGEYYTPDWLAQWMCDRAIDRPLEQRVLDPACGSGTFLFHAVRRFLDAAGAAKMQPNEALEQCTRLVLGIDVHPVAVINARVTYLLAIGEERLRMRPSLSIPVYLGDSLQWNTQELITAREVRIDVPEGPPLIFPIRIAENPRLFDAVVSEMLRLSEEEAPAPALEGWLEREGVADATLKKTLVATYEKLRELSAQGRNHIWGYVARNLSRPAWLSSHDERAQVVIGNPPWLSYRYMSREMQQRFRSESQQRGIWAGGKVATHQDLSAYFFARCVELYLRPHGRIAFVLPYAAMSRQQFAGFRTGSFGAKGARPVASVRFIEAWTFDESVHPLFEVPSCVLFAEEGDAGPLPAAVTAFSGQLPRRDASAAEAESVLERRKAGWPLGAEAAASHYSKRFNDGATVYPRFLFVVRKVESGRFGANPKAPMVESRRTSQEKEPWKSLHPLKGSIETEFLRPLYLGESIAPFKLLEPVLSVLPWHSKLGLLDAKVAQANGYSLLAQWMRSAEGHWNKRHSDMTLVEQLNFYGKLTAQMPPAELRVLYAKAGTLPAAAVLRDNEAVVDHKLYWTAVESEDEARYLTAVLNSETLRKRVAPYQSRGQWGARDFDKLPLSFIPEFDPSSPLHRELVAAASTAEAVASKVPVLETTHFVQARRKIRDALREDGIAAKIDNLVDELLSG